jgi:hypothetical protein
VDAAISLSLTLSKGPDPFTWQAARVIRGSFRLEDFVETVRGVLDDLCPGTKQHQLKMRLALIMAATEGPPFTGRLYDPGPMLMHPGVPPCALITTEM